MGTNYYARFDTCQHCNRGEEVHIGKSSCGWTFGFRAWPEKGIRSWADWQEKLTLPTTTIWDEYGVQMPYDKFKMLVESKMGEKYNHTTYCKADYGPYRDTGYLKSLYLDNEGHSFSEWEFS